MTSKKKLTSPFILADVPFDSEIARLVANPDRQVFAQTWR